MSLRAYISRASRLGPRGSSRTPVLRARPGKTLHLARTRVFGTFPFLVSTRRPRTWDRRRPRERTKRMRPRRRPRRGWGEASGRGARGWPPQTSIQKRKSRDDRGESRAFGACQRSHHRDEIKARTRANRRERDAIGRRFALHHRRVVAKTRVVEPSPIRSAYFEALRRRVSLPPSRLSRAPLIP